MKVFLTPRLVRPNRSCPTLRFAVLQIQVRHEMKNIFVENVGF